MAVTSTLQFAKKVLYTEPWLAAWAITVVLSGQVECTTLTVTAMRPSAECTGLATMAFKTGLLFLSVDKPTSCSLLCLSKISTTLKRRMKDETPCFQPE